MSDPMSDVSLSSSSPSPAHKEEEAEEEEEDAVKPALSPSSSPLHNQASLEEPQEKEQASVHQEKQDEDEDSDSDQDYEHRDDDLASEPADNDNHHLSMSQEYDPAEPLGLEDLMMEKEDSEPEHSLEREGNEPDLDGGDVEEDVGAEDEVGEEEEEAEVRDGDGDGDEAEDDFNPLDFMKRAPEEDDGTPEEQMRFVRQLERFFAERKMEYRHPKFYGVNLNCLKLWRAVVRLGGYDAVTAGKLWRQVGDTFKPPKSCTTVSWSFRGFYEKALLDYERYKMHGIIPGSSQVIDQPDAGEDHVNVQQNSLQPAYISSSGRARRDAASRAMQGWHTQRYFGNGDVGDTIIKQEKGHATSAGKRGKQLKMSLLKKKKGPGIERSVQVSHSKGLRTSCVDSSSQLKDDNWEDTNDPSLFSIQKKKPIKHEQGWKSNNTNPSNRDDIWVEDEGPEADWVKINVHKTRDCFEVYALVPGLLREEVRIQCEPGGQVVIVGEPEHPNNPWGITSFKKVINLPLPIDASQTSAVVTLQGQLFVRVPYSQTR